MKDTGDGAKKNHRGMKKGHRLSIEQKLGCK